MPIARFQMPDGRVARFEVPEGTTPEQAQAMIAEQMGSPVEQQKGSTFAGEGVLRGVYDPFTGLAQTVYNALPKPVQQAGDKLNDYLADKTGMLPKIGQEGFNQAIQQDEAGYQARRGDGIDAQRIAGNVMSPINAALAMKAPQVASLGGRMLSGAGVGAGQAMTMPVTEGDFWTEKAKQGKVGAAVGGVVPAVAGGLARVVSPKASVNPDVNLLKSKGVNPTIGQTLGGWANTTEQKATSLFGVGDSIASARNRTREEFNKAVLNDAVESIGKKVDDVGHAGVKEAGDLISEAYDDALKGLRGVSLDQQGKTELMNLKAMSANMPDTTKSQFNRIINNILMKRMSPKQGMTAETFKAVDSEIGAKAASYGKSLQASEKELGDALAEAQRILRAQAARQNPQYADALAKADRAWAKLVRVEDAAKRSVVNDGVFTPGQYLGAVKSGSRSVRGRDFSRGTALGQDLGEAGQRVLGNTYPDSGTAGRLLNVATGASAMMNLPATAAGMGLGMGAYTPAMQKALVNAVSKRGASAPFAAEEIRKLAPLLNPVGIGLLNGGN